MTGRGIRRAVRHPLLHQFVSIPAILQECSGLSRYACVNSRPKLRQTVA
jgi:hypothetical protein